MHFLTVCEHVQALAVATSVAAEAGYGGYGGAAAAYHPYGGSSYTYRDTMYSIILTNLSNHHHIDYSL